MLEAQILGGVLLVGALVVALVWPMAGEWGGSAPDARAPGDAPLHRRS